MRGGRKLIVQLGNHLVREREASLKQQGSGQICPEALSRKGWGISMGWGGVQELAWHKVLTPKCSGPLGWTQAIQTSLHTRPGRQQSRGRKFMGFIFTGTVAQRPALSLAVLNEYLWNSKS